MPVLNAHEPHIPRVEGVPPGARAAAPPVDNPTDRVTAIMVSRLDSQREMAGAPPAVAGGQSARLAEPVEQKESGRVAKEDERDGVSALEPGYNRALRVRSESPVSPPPRRPGTHSAGAASMSGQERRSEPPRSSRGGAVGDQTSPLPTAEINRIFQARWGDTPQAPPETPPVSPRPDAPPNAPVAIDSPATVHVDGIDLTDITSPGRFTPGAPIQAQSAPVVPLGPSPIDETKWVAGIGRSCDTCRSFQRDPNGRTGICGYPHAFGRRTVVECDQLACRSSINVWWLPNDDFWLDRAEISHHTRPTPNLDALLSELRSETR